MNAFLMPRIQQHSLMNADVKKYLLRFVAVLGFLIVSIVPTQAQGIEASSTSGVAPHAVRFFPTSYTWQQLEEYDFEWNLGDGARANGFMAGHIFSRSTTVTLTVTELTGRSRSFSIRIDVRPTSEFYAGRQTVCVSPDEDFTGAPIGSELRTERNIRRISFEANKRYLFKRGGVWELSSSLMLPENMMLSGFGAATAPRPRIRFSGTAESTMFVPQQGVKVEDVSLEGAEWLESSCGGVCRAWGEGRCFAVASNLLIRNVEVARMTTFLEGSEGTRAHNIFLDSIRLQQCGSYAVFAPMSGLNNLTVRNSTFRTIFSQHGVRINGGERFLMHNCTVDSVGGSQVTLRGVRYALVQDSRFLGEGLYKTTIFPVSAPNATDSVTNVVFERNLYERQIGAEFRHGRHITVRNNVFLNARFIISGTEFGSPQNVRVYHNTMLSQAMEGQLNFREGATVLFQNNIVQALSCTNDPATRVFCLDENPYSYYSSENPRTLSIRTC
jgi:hypothetical protein